MDNFNLSECAAEVFGGPLGKVLAEYDRKVNYKRLCGSVFVIAGAVLFAFDLHILIPLAVIAIGIVIFAGAQHYRRSFFRTVIIPELFKKAVPSLKYIPDMGISERRFCSFGLFGSHDRYHSEDKLSGKIGATSFTAAEVHTEKKHKSKNGTYYSTIFKGVVFIADFNKNINSRTIVLPDIAERYFGKLMGNFLQKMNFLKGSTVRLENPEFEKYFSVYSHDQIEARYILTPQMMEQLIELRKYGKNDVRLLFEGDHIAIAFSCRRGWLEPPAFGRLAKVQNLENILYELFSVISIVEDLDLNTRIWTKK